MKRWRNGLSLRWMRWHTAVSQYDRVRPRRWLAVIAALGFTVGAFAQAQPDPLDAQLRSAMAAVQISAASTSLIIRELDSGQTLVSLHPDEPRNPASVMKTVTTFAALDLLGPGYRWKTEALISKRPDATGRIDDLYLRGQGNPFWVADDFNAFVAAIYARGVRQIDGNLVLDRSYYDVPEGDPAAFDDKPHRVYNMLPDPLTLNFGSLSLLIVPNVAAHRLDVQVDPPVTTLGVDNQITLQRKACKRRNIRLRMNVEEDEAGFTRAKLTGEFPNRCREFELVRVLLNSVNQVVGAFDARWSELGGSWSGGQREAAAPEDAITLYKQVSPPLGDIIRSINKFSNNVMTRQMFLTIGAEQFEAPATLAKARNAVEQSLSNNGIDTSDLFVDNGSGLSRDARVRASTLIDMFDVAFRHRYGSDFFAALPVPGVDGTLEARFDKGQFVGQAHIKTGTLDHVIAMGGLVQAHDGRRYLVTLIINQQDVHRGSGLSFQKKLLRLLVNR